MLDNKLVEPQTTVRDSDPKRDRRDRVRAKMRMATGMVASLKKLSGKAKAKIIEDTMVPKIIEATGEVTIEKKDDYLKLGSYLRDCKLSNFPQKLQRIEDHVNYFYEKNETVVPLDILDNVASTPSLLNIIKINSSTNRN